jgi:DNA-binding LacI/PurR family transcriptional regulator
MCPVKKSPTIYDVAALSGVSITTISRVLNTPEKVNTATRLHVLDAIDKLGFTPKAEARARALQHTGRIVAITPFFTVPSFVQRLRGIAGALSNKNYELVIYTVDSLERLQSYLSSLPIRGNLDGLVIISLPVHDKEIKRLVQHGLPTVLIEYPNRALNSVEIDDIEGGRIAAEHLITKGHTKLAFVGDTNPPEYAIHPMRLRLKGFRKAVHDAGLELPESFVRSAPNTLEHTRQVALELLTMKNPPSAIFAASDFQALSVLKVARQMGIRVPQDLAIIGFDDLDMAEYEDLTTICQSLDESGWLAIDLLLSQIEDPTRPPKHVKIPLTLLERATT